MNKTASHIPLTPVLQTGGASFPPCEQLGSGEQNFEAKGYRQILSERGSKIPSQSNLALRVSLLSVSGIGAHVQGKKVNNWEVNEEIKT